MIILLIKTFFFSKRDSYSLGQKFHTSHFFLSFCEKIMRIVYAIFAIAIKDLEVRLDNLNLPLGKNAIWFEPSTQKGEIGK